MSDNINFVAVKWAAWGSALLTFLSTAFIIAIAANPDFQQDSDCNFEKTREQIADFGNPNSADCIRSGYDRSRDVQGLEIAFSLTDAIAALALIPVALAIGSVFGRHIEMHFAVPTLVVASVISGFELLALSGEVTTRDWLSGPDWDLPADGLRVLSISSFVASGQSLWIFALDDLLLGIGLICIGVATIKFGKFPKWHAYLGIVAGAIGVLTFFLEIARFGDWRLFSAISGIAIGVLGFILLPIWLAVVGFYITSLEVPVGHTSLMDEHGGASADHIDTEM